MSEREGFLSRWSRLKRQAETDEQSDPVLAPAELAGADGEEAAETIDLASLPPVESLGRASDYTAFLARGVPESLQRLALRQALISDPSIAEFRGFAEYDWDCNAPGYGQLLPTDNLARLCDAILGEQPKAEAKAEPSAADDSPQEVPPSPTPESHGQNPAEVLEVEAQEIGTLSYLPAAADADEDGVLPLPVGREQQI